MEKAAYEVEVIALRKQIEILKSRIESMEASFCLDNTSALRRHFKLTLTEAKIVALLSNGYVSRTDSIVEQCCPITEHGRTISAHVHHIKKRNSTLRFINFRSLGYALTSETTAAVKAVLKETTHA